MARTSHSRETCPLVLVRCAWRTLWRSSRNADGLGLAGSPRMDRGVRSAGANYCYRGGISALAARYASHTHECRLPGHLCLAAASGLQGLFLESTYGGSRPRRVQNRHPSHLSKGLVQDSENPAASLQRDRQQDTYLLQGESDDWW